MYARMQAHTRTHSHTHKQTCTHTCTHAHTLAHIRTHAHTYTHTHTHTHTHVHTHACTQTQKGFRPTCKPRRGCSAPSRRCPRPCPMQSLRCTAQSPTRGHLPLQRTWRNSACIRKQTTVSNAWDALQMLAWRACLPALCQEGLGIVVLLGDAGEHSHGSLQLCFEAERM
jgi:hypothetical protein